MFKTIPQNSLNPSFNYLRSSLLADEFVTVSPSSASGDYTSIVAAVNAGHKNIFVKSGTYSEVADIILTGQNLIGESPDSTIINLVNNSIEFYTHTNLDSYSFGTAKLNNNSTTVDGVGGTLWDTGAAAPSSFSNPWLICRGMAFPVSTVNSDTALTIKEQYRGSTQTGNYFLVDIKNRGSLFTGFTVRHNPTVATPCMKVSGIGVTIERNYFCCSRLTTSPIIHCGPAADSFCHAAVIRNNQFCSGVTGIILKNSTACIITENRFQDLNSTGISTDTTDHDCWFNNITLNNFFAITSYGIDLDDGSLETSICNNEFVFLRGNCIRAAVDCDYINIIDNRLHTISTVQPIYFTGACDYAQIFDNYFEVGDSELTGSNISFKNNTIADCEIFFTGNRCNIVSNTFTSGRIHVTGNFCSVISNHFSSANSDEAILMEGSKSVVSNNVIEAAANYGIQIKGTYNVVSSNQISDCSSDGIITSSTVCNYSSITGNVISSPGGYGVYVYSNYCSVSDNIIYDSGDTSIFLRGNANAAISNKIYTSAGHGIEIYAGNSICKIDSNYIEAAATSGIRASCGNSGFTTICTNTIITPGEDGICFTGTADTCFSVSNNTIRSAGRNGIYFDAGSSSSSIVGNVIYLCVGHGIAFDTAIVIHASTISSNNISSCDYGIYLSREASPSGAMNSQNSIVGNICYQNNYGIVCEACRCTITGNRCDSNTNQGIHLSCSNQSIVDANGCDANGGYGIRVCADCDRVIITSDVLLNNTSGQLRNDGTNTVVANNIVA